MLEHKAKLGKIYLACGKKVVSISILQNNTTTSNNVFDLQFLVNTGEQDVEEDRQITHILIILTKNLGHLVKEKRYLSRQIKVNYTKKLNCITMMLTGRGKTIRVFYLFF